MSSTSLLQKEKTTDQNVGNKKLVHCQRLERTALFECGIFCVSKALWFDGVWLEQCICQLDNKTHH